MSSSNVVSVCALLRSAGIEDLRKKRDELQETIQLEEDIKAKLQREYQEISEKIAKATDSLAKKIATKNEYDRMISETEAAYAKVLPTRFENLIC